MYVPLAPSPSFLPSSISIIHSILSSFYQPSINNHPSILQPPNIHIFTYSYIQILNYRAGHCSLSWYHPPIHHQPPFDLITLLVTTTTVLTYIPLYTVLLR